MFGRKPKPAPELDVSELRKLLTQSHRFMARLLGSTVALNDVDFSGIAEGWLYVSRDFKELQAIVPQLRPLATLEDLAERFERSKARRSSRGASRDAHAA